jgi:predicted nucleotidyltransferase component of viral defense system
MIPHAYITEWRSVAPWATDAQTEQDLVISRALVALFQDGELSEQLAFRGGTALYKLYLTPAARYSEDIDLVQVKDAPSGRLLDAIHARLDSWLGKPRYKQGEGCTSLYYRFETEIEPVTAARLKVEISTREHFSVFPIEQKLFHVRSRWYSGEAHIPTYALDELLGTKLRALYQRKKGRDLFDQWYAAQHAEVDPDRVVACMLEYLHKEKLSVTRAEFERNLHEKMRDPTFGNDIRPLLSAAIEYDATVAADHVFHTILARLPGETWKGLPE